MSEHLVHCGMHLFRHLRRLQVAAAYDGRFPMDYLASEQLLIHDLIACFWVSMKHCSVRTAVPNRCAAAPLLLLPLPLPLLQLPLPPLPLPPLSLLPLLVLVAAGWWWCCCCRRGRRHCRTRTPPIPAFLLPQDTAVPGHWRRRQPADRPRAGCPDCHGLGRGRPVALRRPRHLKLPTPQPATPPNMPPGPSTPWSPVSQANAAFPQLLTPLDRPPCKVTRRWRAGCQPCPRAPRSVSRGPSPTSHATQGRSPSTI